MFDFIKIEKELLKFEKPARYIGNELGLSQKDFKTSKVRFVISYPDIYEVGMSNKGIQIIYDRINKIQYASCERVFSPWVDFEEFLKANDLPLFSLETKTPIKEFDIFGVSLQYELLFTNFLNLLSLSGINIFSKDRKDDEPVIMTGGPAVVNPAPYSPFVDLFLIGEGEEVVEKVIEKYSMLKNHKDRIEIIEELSKIESIYSPMFSKSRIKKNVFYNFSEVKQVDNYIIPNIEIVQNKLVVEIMRGCPNKCRFCLAGVLYKPSREKKVKVILEEIEDGLKKLGANEVTFSSLSSSDYTNIIELSDAFNAIYKKDHISFSLPSIRVESFEPELLEKVSSVRKSGLTFAIESGCIDGQRIINKEVILDKMLSILDYAVNNGWRLVKLYFMIGLPFIDKEISSIIDFVDNILLTYKKLLINLNVSVFVPKPHSVFQFEKQLSLEDSVKMLFELENYYRKSRVTVKKHNPVTSYFEGFIARGDENVGLAVYDAFLNGAKFDGWKEYFNYDLYKNAFLKYDITYEKYLSKKDYESITAWDNIDIGLNKNILFKELDKANKKEFTESCKSECDPDCDLCKKNIKNTGINQTFDITSSNTLSDFKEEKSKYLIKFSKTGLMRFTSHIDLINYFDRIFNRSKIKVIFSEGFNPRPRMQFTSALTLGVESVCELLEFYTFFNYPPDYLFNTLKDYEHKDISLSKIKKTDPAIKSSFTKNLYSVLYSFGFKENIYDDIKEKSDFFNKNKVRFSFVKKNTTHNGVYNDFVKIREVSVNKVFLELTAFENIPKIFQIINDIFGDIGLYIVRKENNYVSDKTGIVELFDSIK